MSAFHLGHLAQESTNIGSSSTDRAVVTVISVLSNPNLITLVTNALEGQRRLQGDATSNNAADDRSRGINIDINHIVIPLKDTVDSDLSSLLPNAFAAIDEALGKNVTLSSPSTNNDCPLTEFYHDDGEYHNQQRICLVHCAQGVSRSVSVIVAYLLSRHSHTFNTFDEALQHLRTVRPQALPNGGFAMELRRMERNLDREQNFTL